jgi:hypothetical protein
MWFIILVDDHLNLDLNGPLLLVDVSVFLSEIVSIFDLKKGCLPLCFKT